MKIVMSALLGIAMSAGSLHAVVELPANDCLIGLKDGADNVLGAAVSCTDGDTCDTDGSTDGACTFKVQGCINIPDVEGCTLRPLKKIKFKTGNEKNLLQITPTDPTQPTSLCTDVVDLRVPLKKKGKKAGKRTIVAITTADAQPASQNKDKDKSVFTCNPCTQQGGCGVGRCPETCTNSAGGANQVVLTIGPEGSDLDNGWTGNSHNFPLVANGKIGLCVDNCDGVSDTTCDVCGRTGAGTISGVTFGAPLPLFASNVPVCVISRWREDIRGTIDEANGTTALDIKLFSDVYLTSRDDVCPQCKNGQCNAASGGNAGKPCTVDASIPVYVSSTRTDNYDLSTTCGYTSAPTATLQIDFTPLTSGETLPLTGPTPCTKQAGEPTGVPPQADTCGGSGCGSTCTGTGCVSTVDDPTNPGNQVCVDSKGGLSQFCCNNNTTRPCHKLANGGVVTRTGLVNAPQSTGAGTYPKEGTGVLVSTFCIPATGTNTIDSVTGLPGPGVINLPGTSVWTQ